MAFVGKVKTGNVTGPVGSTLYGTCPTAANVRDKEVTISGLDTLMTGLTIHVKFTNSNGAPNPRLIIRSIDNTARIIYRYGDTPPGVKNSTSWFAGSVLTLTYDGAAWQLNDWQADTIYSYATHDASGLMYYEDKIALDNLVANRTTSLVFTNKSTSAWASDSTYTNFKYKASIACAGITANHFAEVCFNPDDALNYVPASVCQTYNGGVYVWSLVNPGRALTGITVFAVLPDR